MTNQLLSRITTNPAFDTQPVWSPDGQQIAFASDRMGSLDVFIVSREGGEPRNGNGDGEHRRRGAHGQPPLVVQEQHEEHECDGLRESEQGARTTETPLSWIAPRTFRPAPSALRHRRVAHPLEVEIFAEIARQEPGTGGEIQITDAMINLMQSQAFHGLKFHGKTYDCGDKLGFLAANVAFALQRVDLGGRRIIKKKKADVTIGSGHPHLAEHHPSEG